jgi:hypothetical protein
MTTEIHDTLSEILTTENDSVAQVVVRNALDYTRHRTNHVDNLDTEDSQFYALQRLDSFFCNDLI